MQKFIYFLLFALCCNQLGAQIARGDKLLSLSSAFPSAFADAPVSRPQAAYNAGLLYDGQSGSVGLFFGGDYGYALRDRLVLGIGSLGLIDFSSDADNVIVLRPSVRYYAVNAPSLMVFGQVGSSLTRIGEENTYFETLDLTAGLHYPLGSGALLTPKVAYTVNEGPNVLALSVGLELLMNSDDATDEVVAGIRKGRVMIGAESVGFTLRDDDSALGVELGGHYFVLDRLALGAQIGYRGDYARLRSGTGDGTSLTYTTFNAALAARYYLTAPSRRVWFAEAGAGHRRSALRSDILVDVPATSQQYLFFGGGMQRFVRENLALEVGPNVQYNFAGENWTYGLNFGFRYLL
ncbi:hypothetical protein CLV84_2099 [Neolewinella xylanilytica]|uniref:Outer membrane protein with beta-barrel domain n=1 Tax=Neolewinella xylanilytica TaxID=1514080 RepID=A0A2S6I204_9BACT|nr:hypothetical protein [Neolewinella xylanilytica]PPK85207.1 hypothetical protein CLV84_2099 [Neolewinella xylanilytica]